MFIKLFLLTVALSSEVALGMSETVFPKAGAVAVGADGRGNLIYRASDLVPSENAAAPAVTNGTKSVEGEFPPMGMLPNCSATLVGPKVIFTASHCQTTGTRITFKHRGSGKTIGGVCTRHPQYNDRTVYNDYTFCILDEALPAGTQFASFNTSGAPDNGVDVMLNGGGAPNFGVHFWGRAGSRGLDGQDIVTCGPSNLTSGDSGGSLIKWTSDRVNGSLFQIEGVNSRGGGGCSYFNTTSSPEFKAWAPQFAQEKGIEICGVNKDCTKPADPLKCLDEQNVIKYIEGLLGKAKERLALCLK